MDNALSQSMNYNEKDNTIVKTWQLYLLLCIISLVTLFVNNKFIMTRDVYYQLLADQMEVSRIDDYLNMMNKFSIWGYLLTPLLLWVKITICTLLIQFPFTLKSIEIKFKDIFRIIAIANIPLVVESIVKSFWLVLTPSSEYTNEFLIRMPLSLSNLIDVSKYPAPIGGFINNLNLFEASWIALIFWGLYKNHKIEKYDSFMIVFGVWFGIALFQLGLGLYLNS